MLGWKQVGTPDLCRALDASLQGGTGTDGLGRAEGSRRHFWQVAAKGSDF